MGAKKRQSVGKRSRRLILPQASKDLVEAFIADLGHVPSHYELARKLDLSVSGTRNYLEDRDLPGSSVDDDLEQYREAFNRALPIEQRVKLWVELAQGDSVAQRRYALERIDQLSGILSAKERKDASTPTMVPMFTLPPGAQPSLGKVDEDEPSK